MTDHTPDDASVSTEPPKDRTLTWWPIAAAAVIAVLVAVAIFGIGAGDDNRSGSRVADDGALVCPGGYSRSQPKAQNRVPTNPSGVDGDVSLVPDFKPTYLVICRYVPSKDPARRSKDIPLDGRVVLTGGQADAARAVSKAAKATSSRSCTTQTVDDRDSYLLGFTFSTGVVWVSVPGQRCIATSNGQFESDVDFQADAARAYTSRAWPISS